MKFIKLYLSGMLSIGILPAIGQSILTASAAVDHALEFNKNYFSGDLKVKQQNQLLGSSINLPNPEFFIESPTGNFYTGSFTQSFEFPTVYKNQYKLQKSRIGIAVKEKNIQVQDLTFKVRSIYIDAQYLATLSSQYLRIDSAYDQIQKIATRQFQSGQIDLLQKQYAETAYRDFHFEYETSLLRSKAGTEQLNLLTGVQADFTLDPFLLYDQVESFKLLDSSSLVSNRYAPLALLLQQNVVAQKELALQKSKSLPGLALGYFNQGERDTKWINRFRVGFTLPIWYKQYKSQIAAAKTELEIKESNTKSFIRDNQLQQTAAVRELQVLHQAVKYYQAISLPASQVTLNTAERLLTHGQLDYIDYMRMYKDHHALYLKYLDAIKAFNHNYLIYQYLSGQL